MALKTFYTNKSTEKRGWFPKELSTKCVLVSKVNLQGQRRGIVSLNNEMDDACLTEI